MYFDDEGDMPGEDKDEGGDDGMGGGDEEPMDGGM